MVETQNALQKVVCPACGLVNLEKFITFPHCAGCGALLAEAALGHPPISFWHQPLKAELWVTVIAVCCLALGVLGINIARETAISAERPLVIYAQRTAFMRVGQPATMQFMLDTMATTPEASVSHFTKVEVCTPRTMNNSFELLNASPPPDNTSTSVAGDTLEWDDLPREQPILLRLRPKRAGTFRVVISLFAVDFTPFQYRSYIAVLPSQSSGSRSLSALEKVLPKALPKISSKVSPRARVSKVTK